MESAGLRPLRAVRSRNVEASLSARFPNTKHGGINKQDSDQKRGTLRAQVKGARNNSGRWYETAGNRGNCLER